MTRSSQVDSKNWEVQPSKCWNYSSLFPTRSPEQPMTSTVTWFLPSPGCWWMEVMICWRNRWNPKWSWIIDMSTANASDPQKWQSPPLVQILVLRKDWPLSKTSVCTAFLGLCSSVGQNVQKAKTQISPSRSLQPETAPLQTAPNEASSLLFVLHIICGPSFPIAY